MKKIALFPGTFDPITLGHADLVDRALKIFDELIIGVSTADGKNTLLVLDKRMELINKIYSDNPRVSVKKISGLLIDFIKNNDINAVIRGLRNPIDAAYEHEMLCMNRALYSDYETIFLFPGDDVRYISSSRVREISRLGGDIDLFVLPEVNSCIKEVLKHGFENH